MLNLDGQETNTGMRTGKGYSVTGYWDIRGSDRLGAVTAGRGTQAIATVKLSGRRFVDVSS